MAAKKRTKKTAKITSSKIEDDQINFSSKETSKVEIPKNLIDQVIGQDDTVQIIKKGGDPKKEMFY